MKAIKFLGVVVAGALSVTACGNPDAAQQPMQGGEQMAMPVSVASPLVTNITEWDEYTGRFEAVESVQVSARVSGYLESIHFRDGTMVQKGDLLFVIDPRPFEAAVNRAKAEVARTQARLKFTETEVERAEPLLKRNNISREQYDLRIQERNQAKASLDAAKADLRTAELNLEFTEVRAPISGRISDYYVSRGNLISGGAAGATILTSIVSMSPIHFEFTASETDYLGYLRLNEKGERSSSRDKANPVQVKLSDEKEYSHNGVMNFVDNRIDPNTGTMRGRAIFANDDYFLTPGAFGRLRLKGKGPFEAMLIPDSAVVADQSRRMVMTIDANNIVQPKIVSLGGIHDGMRIITSGLNADDKILLDGLMMVRPGMPVSPQETVLELPDDQYFDVSQDESLLKLVKDTQNKRSQAATASVQDPAQ